MDGIKFDDVLDIARRARNWTKGYSKYGGCVLAKTDASPDDIKNEIRGKRKYVSPDDEISYFDGNGKISRIIYRNVILRSHADTVYFSSDRNPVLIRPIAVESEIKDFPTFRDVLRMISFGGYELSVGDKRSKFISRWGGIYTEEKYYWMENPVAVVSATSYGKFFYSLAPKGEAERFAALEELYRDAEAEAMRKLKKERAQERVTQRRIERQGDVERQCRFRKLLKKEES